MYTKKKSSEIIPVKIFAGEGGGAQSRTFEKNMRKRGFIVLKKHLSKFFHNFEVFLSFLYKYNVPRCKKIITYVMHLGRGGGKTLQKLKRNMQKRGFLV